MVDKRAQLAALRLRPSLLSVPCNYCKAPVGEMCHEGGKPISNGGADSRYNWPTVGQVVSHHTRQALYERTHKVFHVQR